MSPGREVGPSGGGELPSPRERAHEAHRRVVAINGALALGVITFVGVVVFLLTAGGVEAIAPLGPAVTWGAAGAGLLALAAGRIVGPRLRDAPRRADAATVVSRWVNGSIISGALAEGAGLMGGVLGLLSGELALAVGLGAVSILAIATGIPSREALEQRLRRLPRP